MSAVTDEATLSLAAVVALVVFAVLGAYDAVYVHLVKERLPARPAAYLEHRIHTARAVLFPGLLVTVFGGRGSVALAVALVVVDQALEVADMVVERASRAHTNGLPTSEYVVHGLLVTAHAAAVAFALALGPARAHAGALSQVVGVLLPGSLVIAVLHLVLATTAGRRWLAVEKGLRATV